MSWKVMEAKATAQDAKLVLSAVGCKLMICKL